MNHDELETSIEILDGSMIFPMAKSSHMKSDHRAPRHDRNSAHRHGTGHGEPALILTTTAAFLRAMGGWFKHEKGRFNHDKQIF